MNHLPSTVHSLTVGVQQAETDEQLIDIWLHGRSPHTQRAYQSDIGQFLRAVEKPLHAITLRGLQEYADELEGAELAPASRHRKLSSIKSLFAFAHRIGYLPFDTARALRLPSFRETLSQRILSQPEVTRMVAMEPHPRNRVMLLLLYASGLRVSELCVLKWRDYQDRDGGCQITALGKGGRTRSILLPNLVRTAINSIRADVGNEAPVFRSRKGGHFHPSQIVRIVRRAARRAGISKDVSPHWLRHAHASHALDSGAPISLVQATLGHSSVATTGRYLHSRPSDGSAMYLDL